MPPRAQAAHQQARHLAAALLAWRLDHRPLPPFHYVDRGSLVSLGQHDALGRLAMRSPRRGILLQGSLARLAYWLLQRQHLALLAGLPRALLATLGGWMSARTRSRVKLH